MKDGFAILKIVICMAKSVIKVVKSKESKTNNQAMVPRVSQEISRGTCSVFVFRLAKESREPISRFPK
jgi:uncharacterized membrane protein